jgi:ribonuclease E
VRVWAHIHHQFEQKAEPGLIYQEQDVVIRSVRDYFTDDIDEVVADNPRVHQRVLEFFQRNMPGAAAKVKLYAGKMPIFSNYGLERQLENIVSPRVPLKSGGYIIINPTEALTAIDVNSGKSKGQDNQEQMAFQTNQEAAEEVARQLRLRDLGGLIVVDFIDMEDARNRREVERVLKKGMKLDKARVEIGRVSRFGLLELSRQRIKARLLSTTHKLCPTCEGSGYVIGTETSGLSMLRRLQELAVSAQEGATIRGRLGVDVALFLLNKQREALAELEQQFKVTIEILPDATAIANRESFDIVRAGGAEKAPEERRDRGDKRSRDRERERDRADKRGPKTRLPQLPRLQAPTRTVDEATGDEEADDDSPFEPPRIVGYVAPEKLVAEAPATGADADADADDEAGDAASGEGDGRRRRRRRKGRGRGEGETSTTAPTPPSAPTPPPAVIAASAPAAEDDDAADDEDEGDEAEGDEGAAAGDDSDAGEARRPRRRRRRRKGRGGEARAPQAPQADDADEPAVAAAVAPSAPVVAPSAPVDADQSRREDARARNRARRDGRGDREQRHEGAVARVLETLGETLAPTVDAPVVAPAAVTPPSEPAVAGRVKDRLRQRAGLAPAPQAPVAPEPVVAATVAPEPVVVAAPAAPPPPPEQVAGRVKDRLRQKAGLAPAPQASVAPEPVVAATVAPEPVVEAAPAAPPPPPEQVAGRVKDRLRQKAGLAPAPQAPVAPEPVVAAAVAPEPVVEAAPAAPPPPPEQVAGRVKDRLRQKAGLAPAPQAQAPVVAAPVAPAASAKPDAPHDRVKDRLRNRRGDAPVAAAPVVEPEVVEPEVVEPEVVEAAPPAPPPEQVASRVKDRLRKKAGLEATPTAQPEPAAKAPQPAAQPEPAAKAPETAPSGDAKSRLKDKLKARTADAPAAPAPAPKAAESAPAPKAEPAAEQPAAPKGRRGKRSGSEAAASVLATLGE